MRSSMRTSFLLLSHRLLHFVHGRHRLLDHPTLRRALTLCQHSHGVHSLCAGEHPCDHQTIQKTRSHRDYTAPCHDCQATLLSKLLQSTLNLRFLFGAIFFNRDSAISCPENMENSACARKLSEEQLAIIQWESTTQAEGTSR